MHTRQEKEAAQQLAKEMESIRYEQMARTKGASMKMLATDQERAEQGNTSMNFLYAKPPGMVEAEAAAAAAGGDDEAVKEFFRKAAEKKKKNEDFSMHSKITALEKMTGRKRRTDELTIEEQVERFPFLKDAPLEGGYVKDVKVTLKPFNKLGESRDSAGGGVTLPLTLLVDRAHTHTFPPAPVRNTRCLRCGEWGHQTGDRECALKDFNPHDAARSVVACDEGCRRLFPVVHACAFAFLFPPVCLDDGGGKGGRACGLFVVAWAGTHTHPINHDLHSRQQREDPLTFMQQGEKQKIVLKLAALPREMAAGQGGGSARACDEVWGGLVDCGS